MSLSWSEVEPLSEHVIQSSGVRKLRYFYPSEDWEAETYSSGDHEQQMKVMPVISP